MQPSFFDDDFMQMYKVVRTDGKQEKVVFTCETELDAKNYADECYKWDSKRIYEYEVREIV